MSVSASVSLLPYYYADLNLVSCPDPSQGVKEGLGTRLISTSLESQHLLTEKTRERLFNRVQLLFVSV